MKFRGVDGFTLIELLIVVAVIGIISAIAMPVFNRARMSANEASAIGSLRAINSAQSTYAASCGAGFYAPTLANLSTGPGTGTGGFIGPDLSTDPSVKSGYTITMTAGTVVHQAPQSCNAAAAGTLVSTYFVGATPIPGGGSRSFGTNQGGTIFQQTPGPVVVTQMGQPAGSVPIQ